MFLSLIYKNKLIYLYRIKYDVDKFRFSYIITEQEYYYEQFNF